MWLFIASPIISWAICLIGVTVYYTFSDERGSGTMMPEFIAVNTTLMTWDAVLFNLSTRELIAKNGYLEDLISGRLEIVLKENPNQIGTLVRILRAIFGKHAVKLGENLIKLILDLLDEFTPEQIINYEKLSY